MQLGINSSFGKCCQKISPTFRLAYSQETLIDLHATGKLKSIIHLDNENVIGYLTEPDTVAVSHYRPAYIASFVFSFGNRMLTHQFKKPHTLIHYLLTGRILLDQKMSYHLENTDFKSSILYHDTGAQNGLKN